MSILGSSSSNNNGPTFQEFKKQASFFFKEKIKTARLALTDVTPAQLLTEEATNGSLSAPDTRMLKAISKAAFEVDDYFRILEILRSRLVKFDKKNWRTSYRALIVIEYLMTHGPESVAKVFQADKDVIRDMACFQLIDEKGFNWGLNVRLKSERILLLLEEGSLLKEERNRARKVSRGIEGFGSFSQRTSSAQGILSESPVKKYTRSKSQFIESGDEEDWFSSVKHKEETTKTMFNGSYDSSDENVRLLSNKEAKIMTFNSSFNSQPLNFETQSVSKENVAPKKEYVLGGFDKRNFSGDSKPLLDDENDESRTNIFVDEDHPFNAAAQLTGASLLSKDHTVQAF